MEQRGKKESMPTAARVQDCISTHSFCIRSLSFSSLCKYLLSSSIHIGSSRAITMSSSRMASSTSSSMPSRIRRPWDILTEICSSSPAPGAFSPPSSPMAGEMLLQKRPLLHLPFLHVEGGLELLCLSPLPSSGEGWIGRHDCGYFWSVCRSARLLGIDPARSMRYNTEKGMMRGGFIRLKLDSITIKKTANDETKDSQTST